MHLLCKLNCLFCAMKLLKHRQVSRFQKRITSVIPVEKELPSYVAYI
jgi:hypothetical protein